MLYTVDDTQLVIIALQGLSLAREFHRNIFLLTENAQKNLQTAEDELDKMWGSSKYW
jgi:hypothetical protein